MSESFLNDRVILHCGDCLDVLATLPENSIDSCCTDPPYHLTSMVKRFGNAKIENEKYAQTSNSGYMSRGFMGKQWDGGDIAHSVELWLQVYRVLKPGAHLLAFGGTRTYHRMACAIEDAGFEIRDCIQWLYGSGFPKSHDVSKGIDRAANRVGWFGFWLKQERKRRGISAKELAERGGFYGEVNHGGLVSNWETGYGTPSVSEFNKVCDILDLPFSRIEELEREIIGQRKVNAGLAFTSNGPTELDITAPATDAARQWQGWGTALKPACEPIVLARKPLSEKTVAANVLKWGTGAINVDGCRAECEPITTIQGGKKINNNNYGNTEGNGEDRGNLIFENNKGRWPANVIHDGSEEVVGAFSESASGALKPEHQIRAGYSSESPCHHGGSVRGGTGNYEANSGSAARFFYTSKADSDDRLGSRHPTVKPLDLMQYLVRLVTPKGGTVLDCFSGTGTTGERETEYQADIRRRMELCLAGPDERAFKAQKARQNGKPQDHGPLFEVAP